MKQTYYEWLRMERILRSHACHSREDSTEAFSNYMTLFLFELCCKKRLAQAEKRANKSMGF